MSSTRKDSLEMFALKALNHPQSARRSSAAATTNGTALARFVSDDQTEFLMRQTRVTVGRSSARSAADVDMGDSSFISRNHLEIYLDHNKFFVLVTGKNGIFVDDMFHRKGSPPVELPPMCQLRFPSTEIKLVFEALVSPEMAVTLPDTANCRDVVMDDSSSRDSVVTDEDTNSCVNAYVEESTSDVVDESSIATEVVPISLETEEVWVPPSYHKEVVSVPFPVNVVKAPSTVKSMPVLKAAGHGSGRPLVVNKSPRDEAKPPYSYAQLIVQAIMSTVDKQLTLSGIYAYITHNYPYYKASDKGWQNSIRHNLSLNRYFIKVARSQEESGKGSFWRIDPASEAMLVEQSFRRRRQRASGISVSSPYLKAAAGSDLSASRVSSRPDSGLSWDEALDNSLIQQAPAVYVSELPSTTAAAPSQRLQDFRWTSAVKSEPASGQSTVKTLSNSNGSRPTIYAYPVQSTSQAGPQQVSQLPSTEGTSSVTTPGTQPPVAILQTALSDNTASWSSSTVFQYITSLTQNAAVKPGTIFISSRPLVSATEDGGRSAVFTNGTALTVTNDAESVIASGDDPFQPTGEAGLEDDTTESDTGSDVNRKRPLDSSEDSSVDIPRIKTPCVDAEDITSD